MKNLIQARILAPDIAQCPAKSRFMSDKNCLTTDTVARREVKKVFYISYRRLKIQKHSVSIGISCPGFFYKHFQRHFTYAVFYIQNRKMCWN